MPTATTEHLCNLCGLSCTLGKDEGAAYPDLRGGLIDATVVGGYDSTPGNGYGALDDLVRHRFSLCEFCLDWLFSQFQIPVAVDDPMNDLLLRPGESIDEGLARCGAVQLARRPDPEPWKPAADRVRKDDWRKMKDAFFAEAERRREARQK